MLISDANADADASATPDFSVADDYDGATDAGTIVDANGGDADVDDDGFIAEGDDADAGTASSVFRV